jgi:hypothetical protein
MVVDQGKETGYKGAGYGWRGGNYNNGAAAGVAALNLNNLRANVNNNVGLRPALSLSQKAVVYGQPSSAEGKRSRIPSPNHGENMNRQGRLVSLHLTSSLPPFCGAVLCPIP